MDDSVDIILYESREQLVADLKRRRCSSKWINNQLAHEEGHLKKALELGYLPKFCLGILEDCGGIKSYRIGIQLNGSASEEDLIQMLSAPENLSDCDKAHLELLKRQIATSS